MEELKVNNVTEQLDSLDVIKNSNISFGTSGARGLVSDFTPEVCAAFTHAFIEVMKQSFDVNKIAIACDNRPSSPKMAQACAQAVINAGLEAVFYGVIPTPALAYSSMQQNIPSIMITGSHIPFDRNGLKFYRPDGEITKADEVEITKQQVTYFKDDSFPKLKADNSAAENYIERYTSLFDSSVLAGKKIGIYEHSSAGRDLYSKIFTKLGAEVTSLERTDTFVPIDTEAVSDDDKEKAIAWSKEYGFDAIFSTDGDGDRPLVADEYGQWIKGDILGLLCAKALEVQAIAVPVSCNTSIEQSGYFTKVVRTKIGSPYVIKEFDVLKNHFPLCAGFEANGGFILGSDVKINNNYLKSLPTRDAVTPVVAILALCGGNSIAKMIEELPNRYTASDRLKDISVAKSKLLLKQALSDPNAFLISLGLDKYNVIAVDETDGLRMTLEDDQIIHLRPSGNAPELRCYSESSEQVQAELIVKEVLNKVLSI
jgi:phosphomannomutase